MFGTVPMGSIGLRVNGLKLLQVPLSRVYDSLTFLSFFNTGLSAFSSLSIFKLL